MKKLTIISTNHLGIEFWEERTGLIGQIDLYSRKYLEQLNRIDTSSVILFDFYFTSDSFLEEIIVCDQLKKIMPVGQSITVFIVSPRYAMGAIKVETKGEITFVKHRFSQDILEKLDQLLSEDGNHLSIHAS